VERVQQGVKRSNIYVPIGPLCLSFSFFRFFNGLVGP